MLVLLVIAALLAAQPDPSSPIPPASAPPVPPPAPPPPPAALPPGAKISIITRPDWAALPTWDQMRPFFPRKAWKEEIPGWAMVQCLVSLEGVPHHCELQSETPAGYGFGEATLKATANFRFKPASVNGQPVSDATVRVPVAWALPGLRAPRPVTASFVGDELVVEGQPPIALYPTDWLSSAGPANRAAQRPKGPASGAQGDVSCTVAADGALTNCSVLHEFPSNRGVGDAAIALTTHYRLPELLRGVVKTEGATVRLRIWWLSAEVP